MGERWKYRSGREFSDQDVFMDIILRTGQQPMILEEMEKIAMDQNLPETFISRFGPTLDMYVRNGSAEKDSNGYYSVDVRKILTEAAREFVSIFFQRNN